MQIDVVKREMPGYGLKDLAKYIGKAKEDRIYIEGSEIASIWDGSHPSITIDELLEYAYDDVEETMELDKKFGASYFFASQFAPMGYQDVFRLGTETSITGIFLREYYRQGYSIPEPEPPRRYGGGFAGHNFVGHLKQKAIGIDIESQYPSLGDELNIELPNDILKIYKPILKTLKALRVKYKNLAKEGGVNAEMYDAQQSIYKIYLNTMSYGVLGSASFPWNFFDGAELITVNGQNVLRCMMRGINNYGGKVIKWDTDGILCTYPQTYEPNDFLNLIQQHLTKEINDGKVFQRSLNAARNITE
jgi:DNA polymerase elongation subunit (family B)